MKIVTVGELQKTLQKLADQVGGERYPQAKALIMEGLVCVSEDTGEPVDISTLDYEVVISAPVAAVEAAAEAPAEVETAKTIATEVAKAVRAELSVSSPKIHTKIGSTVQSQIKGKTKHFQTNEEAYRFGTWARAAMGHRKSLQFCEMNGIISKDQTESVNSQGGWTVPEEFSNALITLRESFGIIRQNANVINMASDTLRIPRRSSTLTAYFVGEATAGTESNQVFDSVMLVARKVMVLTQISNELSEDNTVQLADGIAAEAAYAISNKEDLCGFTGDGTSTFGGIVGLKSAVSAGVKTAGGGTTSAGTFATMTLAEIRTMMGTLPQYADVADTKFYMHRSAFNAICQRLAEGAGGASIVELADGANPARFLGYPVVYTQVMPSTTSTGVVAMHFGSMRQAVMLGSRRENTISFSDSALNGFESDLTTVRSTARFDINCANVGTATTAGSIVSLYTAAT